MRGTTRDFKVVKLFVTLIWRGQNRACTSRSGRMFSVATVVGCRTRNTNLRPLRPDVHCGAHSTSSLRSSPDPNHWFSVWDAHSSHMKIIFLQCSQACFIVLDKIYALDTVLSVKWEYSDSVAARKYMPSIRESLVES